MHYYYKVSEFVTSFGLDPKKNDSVSHHTEFKPDRQKSLLKCRLEAIAFYESRLIGLENSDGYFLPFAAPDKFKHGVNSAYSVDLYLVQECNNEKGDIKDTLSAFNPDQNEETKEARPFELENNIEEFSFRDNDDWEEIQAIEKGLFGQTYNNPLEIVV
ncbi:hypothetical protein MASR2M41_08140 [Flammeovirgaceae bacterium]